MHIVLNILRNVVVEHHINVINIDAAGCNVRRNQHINRPTAETRHHPIALHLFHITMQCFHEISARRQACHQIVNRSFCITEDQCQLRVVHIQQPAKCLKLITFADLNVGLLNLRHRQFAACNLHKLWIMLESARNVQNRRRHCC